MQEVTVGEKRLHEYRSLIGPSAYHEIAALAAPLAGKRVAHVNATSFGGGVAELLHSIVPLMRDVGLDARWFVLDGSKPFFDTTKALHNALQGKPISLTSDMRAVYRTVNETNAAEFREAFDVVVVHDPQPAPLVSLCDREGAWVWRCHIDLTSPYAEALALIAPYVREYDACIFSAEPYVPRGVPVRRPFIAPPAIDPLSPKNREVSSVERDRILSRLDFDPNRPVVSQVGRFDPWKDPLGAIDAYRLVRREVPDVQLLLVGSMARDDPEGWNWFERTARHAGADSDVHLLTEMRGVEALEVNVIQRESDVGLLKSLREGFGLTVSESLWKGVPVVGGDVTGIAMQVEDGRSGYLVSSVEQAAERILALLRDGERRKAMGAAGRERVRERFLITRYLRDYLRLFAEVSPGT